MMDNKPRWTLKSIAKELGVSNATVSNAFNRPDQLSERRRLEILSACERMGYYGPNKAAQSLRKGKFNIVGLVLPDSVEYMVSDPVASSFMRGVASVLEKNHTNLLLFSGNSPSVNSVTDFVDGFICYGRPRNRKLVEQLKRIDKKIITVDFDIDRAGSINVDNQQACYEIARQAIRGPDERVAVLGLRLIDSKHTCRVYEVDMDDKELQMSIAHQRLRGYQQALEECGIALAQDRLWNIPESSERYADLAAREVLTSTPRPTLVLCMSDLIALAMMRKAIAAGLRVPEDIRIVGFDGTDEAARFIPALTTVHQNSQEKGRRAAQMFIDNDDHREVIEYRLLAGQSI